MTAHTLIVPIVELQPQPPPYGELYLRKGAWDQLQARKAYQGTLVGGETQARRKTAIDLAI